MIRLALALCALSLFCLAADEAQAPSGRRVVDIKHLKGDRLKRATAIVNTFLMPTGDAHADDALGVVVLRGSDSMLPAAEALLRRFDVPSNAARDTQIQLTIYLVEASEDTERGGPIPPGIANAVEQMRKTFTYKNYRLLDTVVMQAKNGNQAEVTGVLPVEGPRPDVRTSYVLNVANMETVEGGGFLSLSMLRFRLMLPVLVGNSLSYKDAGLTTSLTLQNRQKLVLGKLSSEQIKNAIFLIITADF